MLINDKRELVLIDFDAFKTKFILTNKYKKYIIKQLRKIYTDVKRSADFEEYCKSKIDNVIKELNWKI